MYRLIGSSSTISEYVYNSLSYLDKRKYERAEDRLYHKSILDTAVDVGIGMVIGSIFSDNDSCPSHDNSSSSSSFDGFDGGDFGGSGSSSDW